MSFVDHNQIENRLLPLASLLEAPKCPVHSLRRDEYQVATLPRLPARGATFIDAVGDDIGLVTANEQ